MSLVVGTNTSAQFAQDALRANQHKIATAMQRLSTGLRINSARDDAAGLAISQSMTSQIRGLNQAVRNINDGVNLLQTAEGGLSSISDMLQRMRELAVQSANGTNSDAQRAYLQKEAAALQEQIGKVVDTTTWNDKKLLDGSFTGQKIQVGADSGATMDLTIPTTIGSSVQTVTNTVTTATPKILLLGRTSGSLSPNTNAGDVDMFIQQVDSSLAPSFTKQIGTAGEDLGSRILAVADGSFYVSGWSNGNLDGQTNHGGIDGFLSRYSADGTKLWTQLVGSTGDDYVNGLAASSDGSIYVFGTTNGNIDGNINSGDADVFVSKFQSDGTKLWTKTLGRAILASGGGIATNSSGEIYISGSFTGSRAGINSSGDQDGFISKLQPDGTISWTRTFGTTGDDPISSVRVAPDGTVFATGRTGGSLNGQPYLGGAPISGWPVVGADAFLIKYDSNGNSVWTKSWGTSSYDAGRDIAFDSDGGIYVVVPEIYVTR